MRQALSSRAPTCGSPELSLVELARDSDTVFRTPYADRYHSCWSLLACPAQWLRVTMPCRQCHAPSAARSAACLDSRLEELLVESPAPWPGTKSSEPDWRRRFRPSPTSEASVESYIWVATSKRSEERRVGKECSARW